MAFYDAAKAVTGIAGSAVTIGRFVTRAADGQYDHAATAQGSVDGICAETVATVGRNFGVVIPDGSLCKVEAGATIADGDEIATDTSGRAIVFISGTVNNVSLGRAIGAAVLGDMMTIQFFIKRTAGGT